MVIDLAEYQRLKTAADDAQRKAERAAGALEQIKARLKTEFGCDNVKDGKAKLARLNKEVAELEERYTKELAAIRKDFKV